MPAFIKTEIYISVINRLLTLATKKSTGTDSKFDSDSRNRKIIYMALSKHIVQYILVFVYLYLS